MNGASTSAGNETNKNDKKLPPRSKRESRLYAWYTATRHGDDQCPHDRVEAEEDRHEHRGR